jgi:hypothetical protein
MTLLITVIAAVISTVVWYFIKSDILLGRLSLMYFGASLMWLVDTVVEFIENGAQIFTPTYEAMINDAFLGVCVVTLGLIVWLIMLVVKDPKGKIRLLLKK